MEREIVRRTSEEELAWARVHVVTVQSVQEQMFYDDNYFRRNEARDRGMAYVATAIPAIRFPSAKVALWAHNGHIMNDAEESSYGITNMGSHLEEELGRLYATVGLTSYEFNLEWANLGLCGAYYFDNEEAAELLLYQTGEQALLVDFTPSGGEESIFGPDTQYTVGGLMMTPADQFDALIYMESSPAMTPLHDFETCP
jgi:erythromycin esterase-like protein